MNQPTDVAPTAAPTTYAPIALAASAGGLDALTAVLGTLPADLPAPVIVLEHLQPDHSSYLAEILSRRTALRVKEAEDGDELEPGVVYVAPPNAHTTVQEGRIALDRTPPVRYVRPSADRLFESLAWEYRERAIVVVLTGTGSDGAAGALAVHDAGGTVYAQQAATAAFPGMPAAVVESGAVDAVFPLEELGAALAALVKPRAAT